MSIVISCEVGGSNVPRQLIAPDRNTSRSIRFQASKLHAQLQRYDQRRSRKRPSKKQFGKYGPGRLPNQLRRDSAARYVSQRMASQLSAPIIENQYSLDLIDVTRSINHPQLFPILTRHWSAEYRQMLIDEIYTPHRNRLNKTIGRMLGKASYAVHLSVRSFKDMSPGKSGSKPKHRRADVGLVYDVSAVDEVDLSAEWYEEMYFEADMLRVRRNYPRRGTVDSITKAMRSEFDGEYYIGIEVLVNQAWALRRGSLRQEAVDRMCESLKAVLHYSQAEEIPISETARNIA